VKRSGRDEPLWAVIHKCMETTQGIFLYSCLYLKLAKMPCFFDYLLYISFYKNREQEGGAGSAGGGMEEGCLLSSNSYF
jgi:hypothetical protein